MVESTKNRFGARIIGIVTKDVLAHAELWSNISFCDFIEFRADFWESAEMIPAAKSFRADCIKNLGRIFPTIFTIRLKRDGGFWPDNLALDREVIYIQTLDQRENAFCEWLDLEYEEYSRLSEDFKKQLRASKVKTLISHHQFNSGYSSEALNDLSEKMLALRSNGIKLALNCKSEKEIFDLMALAARLGQRNGDSAVLSMGELGQVTRVLAPLLHCPFTYGILSGESVAPGQFTVVDLRKFYSQIELASTLPEGLASTISFSGLQNSENSENSEKVLAGTLKWTQDFLHGVLGEK